MTYIIGIDPGPMPGVVGLWVQDRRLERTEVVQCSDSALLRVLQGLAMPAMVVAAERFVVGHEP